MEVHSYARDVNSNKKCDKTKIYRNTFLFKQNNDFFSYHKCLIALSSPTKDRKGLKPPKRTEKNFRAPKRTYICHFYTKKHMF